jgi:hypothetical protein
MSSNNIRRRLREGEGILVSIRAMADVMKRHNLQPDKDGNVQITPEMIAEAEAIDREEEARKLMH